MIETIVAVANSYVGQREKPGNLGFIDSAFEEKMKAVGWFKGAAWCAYFSKLVYKEAMQKEKLADIQKLMSLFSPMAIVTYRKFDSAGYNTDKTPKLGSLVVWQKGTTAQGHIGIVTKEISSKNWISVEGNTNGEGSRDGEVVAAKNRTITGAGSLKMLGFIHIFD